MYKIRKKSYSILILVLLIGITIGYSVLNTSLNINGKSNISKNTWDVHFENLKIISGSVTASVEPTISNDTSISNFEVKLDKPGDYYEFIVDVVNDGTIDAMVENVEKNPDLTTEQQKYLNYIIEYQNGEEIEKKQLVEKESYVRIRVRVEYKKDISASDLPQNAETLNLSLSINYVQSDNNDVVSIENNGKAIKLITGDGTNTSDELCIGSECFYVMYSTSDKVVMLSKYNLYVGYYCSAPSNTSCSLYGDEATGKQDSNMLAYAGQSDRKGAIGFSDTTYWTSATNSYPTYVYNNNSLLYEYIENYKSYINTIGIMPSVARLISYEELIDLGCSTSSTGTCGLAPEWLYTGSYWTGTALDVDDIYIVSYGIKYYGFTFNNYSNFGLRPVLEIPKDYF